MEDRSRMENNRLEIVWEDPLVGDRSALVAGGGGFIGGHLAADLLGSGYARVRCVDIKPLPDWHQVHRDAENLVLDLRESECAERACQGMDEVFNLAADMGGMGFIENNRALCMISVLINTHLLLAARDRDVSRYFYASSACVYRADLQRHTDVTPLREEDAYPAMAEDGYGWEKLFSERMCRHFREDFGLETRLARLHNVYGPFGTYDGGREKAPAAICRKVIEAVTTGRPTIEIWGDGRQTRSFCYIDDAIHGIRMVHEGHYPDPVNVGSGELVAIDQLVDIVEDIANVKLERIYDPSAPTGVRGRSSDNALIRREFGWEPSTSLAEGLEQTYAWIYEQMVGGTTASGRRSR
jgi:nucleoside-diphosphate-sugar epimerase